MSDAMIGPGTGIVILYTLDGEPHHAETAAAAMVGEGLAACANVQAPCKSFYIWNDLPEKQTEYPVLFKTSIARRDALMARIAETHPYDVPAISSWDATTTTAYGTWVGQMTEGR